MKTCNTCGLELPYENFWKSSTSKDGYQPQCNVCNKYWKRLKSFRDSELNKGIDLEGSEQRFLEREAALAEKATKALEPKTTKVCNTCSVAKPFSEFYASTRAKDGLQSKCISCDQEYKQQNKEHLAEYRTEYERLNKGKIESAYAKRKAKDPEKFKRETMSRTYKYVYGITLDERDALMATQSNKCAICGAVEEVNGRRFCIDHDHATGKIRGILCVNCNSGIGQLRDSLELLKSATAYLERHQNTDVLI